jgi:hypothetical protein
MEDRSEERAGSLHVSVPVVDVSLTAETSKICSQQRRQASIYLNPLMSIYPRKAKV